MGGMNKTTVYLPADLKRALREAARSSGVSEAELIREGIGRVTAERLTGRARIPLFESKKPDLAEQVDEHLAGFGER